MPRTVIVPIDAMEDQPTRSLNVSLDDNAPESDTPQAFEVCPTFLSVDLLLTREFSILLIMIHMAHVVSVRTQS